MQIILSNEFHFFNIFGELEELLNSKITCFFCRLDPDLHDLSQKSYRFPTNNARDKNLL